MCAFICVALQGFLKAYQLCPIFCLLTSYTRLFLGFSSQAPTTTTASVRDLNYFRFLCLYLVGYVIIIRSIDNLFQRSSVTQNISLLFFHFPSEEEELRRAAPSPCKLSLRNAWQDDVQFRFHDHLELILYICFKAMKFFLSRYKPLAGFPLSVEVMYILFRNNWQMLTTSRLYFWLFRVKLL